MRATLVGLLVGVLVAAVIVSAGAEHSNLYAQRHGGPDVPPPPGEGLTALLGPVIENQQLVVLIDEERQTMGTYHVQVESGQISLRSIRNIRWDLQMDEFNGAEPSPDKIQALLRNPIPSARALAASGGRSWTKAGADAPCLESCMAKLIKLEEAAELLGISAEQLTEMRSRNEVFGYRDGATWKFKQRRTRTCGARNKDLRFGGNSSDAEQDEAEQLGRSG